MFPRNDPCCSAAFEDHFNRKSPGNYFMISKEFNREKRYFIRRFYFGNIFPKTFYKILIDNIITILIIKYFQSCIPKFCLAFNPEYPLLQILQLHYHLPGKVNEPSG